MMKTIGKEILSKDSDLLTTVAANKNTQMKSGTLGKFSRHPYSTDVANIWILIPLMLKH